MVYVDNSIIIAEKNSSIDNLIQTLKKIYQLTDEGQIQDHLGIHVVQRPDGTINLSQLHLINQILTDVCLSPKAKRRHIPAVSSRILQRCEHAPSFAGHFNYRSIVGKLNFLGKGSRPDIAHTVHQLACFSEDPTRVNFDPVLCLCSYLQVTRTQGILLKVNVN